jgi:hypothetical protein
MRVRSCEIHLHLYLYSDSPLIFIGGTGILYFSLIIYHLLLMRSIFLLLFRIEKKYVRNKHFSHFSILYKDIQNDRNTSYFAKNDHFVITYLILFNPIQSDCQKAGKSIINKTLLYIKDTKIYKNKQLITRIETNNRCKYYEKK